jgi:predicted CoA-binding protein
VSGFGAETSNPADDELRALLARTRRIAVVGLSPKPFRDSHRVARYLQERGYEVFPVYPREEQILGRPVHRRVQDIAGGVDLVNVFRRSSELAPVFDDAIAARAPAIWTQYDCVDEASALRARAAGLVVVMDRCLMVEHSRLVGR